MHTAVTGIMIRNEYQIEWGQWSVYYTSPQSFILTISYLLAYQVWGLLMNFDCLVY